MEIQRRAFEVGELREDAREIDFVCSTETRDRHGTVIKQDWDLSDYQKNPVVLKNHDSWEDPIGLAKNVRVESGELKATVQFLTSDLNQEAERQYQLYKNKVKRGISVGFTSSILRFERINDVEIPVFSGNKLVELSLCSVGSNPDAVSRSLNMDQIGEFAKLLGVEAQFGNVLGAMRALKDNYDAAKMRVEQLEKLEQERAQKAEQDRLAAIECKRIASIDALKQRGLPQETIDFLAGMSADVVEAYVSKHEKSVHLKTVPTGEPREGSSLSERVEGLTFAEIRALAVENSDKYIDILSRQDNDTAERIMNFVRGKN